MNELVGWYVFGLLAVPGAAIAVYGLAIHATSIARFENVRGPPVVRPRSSRRTVGLSLQASF